MLNLFRKLMIVSCKLGSFAFICLFIQSSVAIADMGVFNLQITPREFQTNTSTNVKVSAEVGTDVAHPLIGTSVVLYETDATGKPIRSLGQMYDDGTHGDMTASDTIFTTQFSASSATATKKYYQVTVAYKGMRNRYVSPVIQLEIFAPIPVATLENASSVFKSLQDAFDNYIKTMSVDNARQLVLQDAKANPDMTTAELQGATMFVIYRGRIHGSIDVSDPSNPTQGAGRSYPNNLPSNYKAPGNDKILIFAPEYTGNPPLTVPSDHAAARFGNAEYMTFTLNNPPITKDASASLDVVKQWGNYGAVIVDSHGGIFSNRVVIQSGTPINATTLSTYNTDFSVSPPRLAQTGSGKIAFYPEFITSNAVSMKDTFFYLGACDSLKNDTMWNALKAKGAKVAFGFDETVLVSFNRSKFQDLIDAMVPVDTSSEPATAKSAYDGIWFKTQLWPPFPTFTMRTASQEWENFVFVDGGIVNGDFETGDFTGWTHGADPGNYYGYVTGARVHGGTHAAVLGRWDTAFTGADPTLEPYGNEWIYQDFTVPTNATNLSFWWFMETYDTALWDWFDAKIMDTATGVELQNIVYHGGKPGSNYGPYWNSGSWQYQEADVTAYRGQKIRIYFGQMLDGFGDQTRTFIDDVRVD